MQRSGYEARVKNADFPVAAMKRTGSLTFTEVIEKARHYCAYQERSHTELRRKLQEWRVPSDEAEAVISNMIETGFLNEERFARAYAGGKFRTRKWGRNRIRLELKQLQVSDYCILQAMKEIPETDYRKALTELCGRKQALLKEKNPAIRRNKVAAYLIGKGFEPELAWDAVQEIR